MTPTDRARDHILDARHALYLARAAVDDALAALDAAAGIAPVPIHDPAMTPSTVAPNDPTGRGPTQNAVQALAVARAARGHAHRVPIDLDPDAGMPDRDPAALAPAQSALVDELTGRRVHGGEHV